MIAVYSLALPHASNYILLQWFSDENADYSETVVIFIYNMNEKLHSLSKATSVMAYYFEAKMKQFCHIYVAESLWLVLYDTLSI